MVKMLSIGLVMVALVLTAVLPSLEPASRGQPLTPMGPACLLEPPTPTPYVEPSPGATARAISRAGGPFRFQAGWNLIGGDPGAVSYVCHADGPLYTYQADMGYETVPSESFNGLTWTTLQPETGYWVYFDQPTDVLYFTPPSLPSAPVTINLPAGQYVLVASPFFQGATLTGADEVYTYDPVSGYQETDRLHLGQAAFVYSALGGSLTLSVAGR
jgi:hypothetical protein